MYVDTLVSRDARLAVILVEPVLYAEAGGPGTPADEVPHLSDAESARMIDAIHAVVARFERPGFRIGVGGSPVMNARISELLRVDSARFLLAATLLNVVIPGLVFGRASGVLLPIVVVVAAVVSTLGAMVWIGLPGSIPLQILPVLLLVVGVSRSRSRRPPASGAAWSRPCARRTP